MTNHSFHYRKQFKRVVDYARLDESKQFSKHDKKLTKHLLKPETGFHRGENDPRFLELLRMQSPEHGFGFKVDLDAVAAEYGIARLLQVLRVVIETDQLL